MSQSVVDMLEVIQIQIQQSAFAACLLRLIDLPCQIPFAAHAVIQSRQEIRIGLLLDAALIQFFICNVIQGIQIGLFTVHPGNLLAQQIVPGLLLRMIYHADGFGSVFTDTGLQQCIEIMIHQFLGKGIFQNLIGKKHPPGALIRYVNGAAHIVQDFLQRRIRTGQ